jgi:hypothetical protein
MAYMHYCATHKERKAEMARLRRRAAGEASSRGPKSDEDDEDEEYVSDDEMDAAKFAVRAGVNSLKSLRAQFVRHLEQLDCLSGTPEGAAAVAGLDFDPVRAGRTPLPQTALDRACGELRASFGRERLPHRSTHPAEKVEVVLDLLRRARRITKDDESVLLAAAGVFSERSAPEGRRDVHNFSV